MEGVSWITIINGERTKCVIKSDTMFQTHAEVHSDVRERRGKKREEEGERGSERGGDTKMQVQLIRHFVHMIRRV